MYENNNFEPLTGFTAVLKYIEPQNRERYLPHIQKLVQLGISFPNYRDEIYILLCKQSNVPSA